MAGTTRGGRSRSAERPGRERNDGEMDEAPGGGRTLTKTVRATSSEIERVNDLLPSMPEAGTEAAALRLLLLDGLQLREAAVVAAGGKLPEGVTMPQLVAALAQRVLPVLPLLARYGMIPQMAVMTQLLPADVQPSTPAPSPQRLRDDIDESAADDVGGMGGGLL